MRISKISKSIQTFLARNTKPVSVAEMLLKVEANKTSLYRQLEKLVQQRIVNEVDFGDGSKRYELVSLGHHHHLICKGCKKVEEVNAKENLNLEEKRLEKETGFKQVAHSLEFYGFCGDCFLSLS